MAATLDTSEWEELNGGKKPKGHHLWEFSYTQDGCLYLISLDGNWKKASKRVLKAIKGKAKIRLLPRRIA